MNIQWYPVNTNLKKDNRIIDDAVIEVSNEKSLYYNGFSVDRGLP